MEDRIESLKNQVQILETKVDDEARFSIGLAMTGAQLVDISGESYDSYHVIQECVTDYMI